MHYSMLALEEKYRGIAQSIVKHRLLVHGEV